MTRGTKLGGGALLLALLCLGAWHYFQNPRLSARIAGHLPRTLRRYLLPKPKPSPRMASLPNVYLWAWERPEDLEFLAGKKVGVAFLAKTLSFKPPLVAIVPGGAPKAAYFNKVRVNVRPRLQPLRINPGTPLMAVVRIESVREAFRAAYASQTASEATLSPGDLSVLAAEIASAAQITDVTALQIDFDATQSERALYRDLLIEVRNKLPANLPLSITALASWCIGDRWLVQLPPGTIDEAVPMLFRMGASMREITNYLATGNDFTVPACSTSLGLSTDEPFSRDILSGKVPAGTASLSSFRVYLFSPRPWDQVSATKQLEALQ